MAKVIPFDKGKSRKPLIGKFPLPDGTYKVYHEYGKPTEAMHKIVAAWEADVEMIENGVRQCKVLSISVPAL